MGEQQTMTMKHAAKPRIAMILCETGAICHGASFERRFNPVRRSQGAHVRQNNDFENCPNFQSTSYSTLRHAELCSMTAGCVLQHIQDAQKLNITY